MTNERSSQRLGCCFVASTGNTSANESLNKERRAARSSRPRSATKVPSRSKIRQFADRHLSNSGCRAAKDYTPVPRGGTLWWRRTADRVPPLPTASKQFVSSLGLRISVVFDLQPTVAVVLINAELPLRHNPLKVTGANLREKALPCCMTCCA